MSISTLVLSTTGASCGGGVDTHGAGDAAVTPPGAGAALTGAWDVVGAGRGEVPKSGLIVLGSDRLTVTFGQGSLEFAANPFVVDLIDDVPRPSDVLTASLESKAPRLSAARSLVAGVWASADGDLSVRLAARCDDPGATTESMRCIPLWPAGADEDAEAERARFFAWPLAHAAVLRAAPGEVQAIARALRAASTTKDDPIALVLTRELDDDSRKAIEEIRRAAREAHDELRGTPALPDALRAFLDELTADGEESLALLPIDTNEVLVVPRLHVVATPAALADAIGRRLAARALHATSIHPAR